MGIRKVIQDRQTNRPGKLQNILVNFLRILNWTMYIVARRNIIGGDVGRNLSREQQLKSCCGEVAEYSVVDDRIREGLQF